MDTASKRPALLLSAGRQNERGFPAARHDFAGYPTHGDEAR